MQERRPPMHESQPRALERLARPLALAVTVLLFAQWPLREVAGGAALLANDVAQCLFALYVAVAVPAAAARGAHIAAHPQALQGRWRRVGAALVPLPWCAWVLATAAAPVWASVRALERFPETTNPGYFVVKLALVLLAAGVALESLRALRRALD